MDASQRSQFSSENKPDTVLIACDTCYIRKIRCDRDSPCGNCIDSKVSCQRERQKTEKKPRETVPKEVLDAMNEIKERMATMEKSLSHLILLSTNSKVSSQDTSRKRTRTDASHGNISQKLSRSSSPYITAGSQSNSTPPFSAHEAQTLIQEVGRCSNLTTTKQAAFHSALSSLKQTLNTSIQEHDSKEELNPERALEALPIPHIALIQWMLQSGDPGRSVCSGSDFMPFTSRKSIARMAQRVVGKPSEDCDLASLICVASYAGYFLQEIVLSGQGEHTGLEDQLRLQAHEYFTTARAATSRILKDSPSTLENLQALTFGVLLAQEAGDFAAAWRITEAASKMCINLRLHKSSNTLSDYPDAADEAYYCFAVCYKNDKGLAMNLGRPPLLQDSIIEVDILRPPNSNIEVVDNFRIYLELAQVQSQIVTKLRPTKEGLKRAGLRSDIFAKMNYIWELNKKLQEDRRAQDSKYDSEMESEMVNFAFYSVKTVLFHSGAERLQSPETNYASLDTARSALNAMQTARQLSKLSQYNNTYMRVSLAHWTILHYPFTAFFVIFCNVILTRHVLDYNLMQQFVAYLAEIKDISTSVAKLHKLCLPFCSLALSILNLGDDVPLDYEQSLENTTVAMPSHTPPWQQHITQSTAQQSQLLGIYNTSAPQGSDSRAPYAGRNEPYGSNEVVVEDFMWDFMDTQPVLQWLDSDFSVLRDAWGVDWNVFPR